MSAVLLASSVLATVLVILLIREHRLRRALESLLRRLIRHWRSHEMLHTDDTARAPAERLRK